LSQLAADQPVVLAPKTSSYQRWADALANYRQLPTVQAERAYWQQVVSEPVNELPVTPGIEDQRYQHTETLTVSLDSEMTRALLQEANQCYHTQINDLLLTALLQVVRDWVGGDGIRLDLEGHGREALFDDIDLHSTVGWFTTLFPVHLRQTAGDMGEQIKRVKEQLRTIPHNGIGYGLLADEQADQPSAEILFNYLGQFDQTTTQTEGLAWSFDNVGECVSDQLSRRYVLSINSEVSQGQLQVVFDYHQQQLTSSTVQQLATAYRQALEAIIGHCLQARGGYTASDFPLATLSQAQLDSLMVQYPTMVELFASTPMQQGMIFHSQLAAASGVYMTQLQMRLSQLDPERFKRSWQQLASHHPVFRTAFISQPEGDVLQLVQAAVTLPWTTHDWQHLSDAAQQQTLADLLVEERATPFDFAQPPLMRLVLIQLSADQYQFIWTHHHA
ncbi:non-ribosomal peptide synthetase, partial [Endozoicomonas sp. SM1973]